ncbi:MAG: hypothetical protein ACK5NN_13960 [Sphingomonadaceae bacterium]
MSKQSNTQTREERLAERLRENLRRRKAQSREMDEASHKKSTANPSQTGQE